MYVVAIADCLETQSLYQLLCLLTAVNYSTSYSAANTSSSQIAIVRYAYVVIGAIVFVAAVLHTAAYWQDRRAKHAVPAYHLLQVSSTQQTTDDESSDMKPSKRHCREK